MKKIKKLCFLYENRYRNDGAPLYWFEASKKMGYEATHLLPYGDISRFGDFDAYIHVDYGADGLPLLEDRIDTPSPSIFVASDTHLGFDWRLAEALKSDFVFCNQKRAVDEFKEKGVKNAVWLPHAVEPIAYPRFEITKKFDVCFIGHLQTAENYNKMTRVDALDRLFKEFPNFYYGSRNPSAPQGYCLFEDAAKKFCQSKIVFNISIGDDVNMRVFETLSTGSFLLTNWLPTLGELFEDGKHLVTYKTYDEMIDKAKYYLAHDEEREVIAKAGQKECLEKHTYQNRIKTALEYVEANIGKI